MKKGVHDTLYSLYALERCKGGLMWLDDVMLACIGVKNDSRAIKENQVVEHALYQGPPPPHLKRGGTGGDNAQQHRYLHISR
jgi:hypothetical protein